MPETLHPAHPLPADIAREYRTGPVPPVAHGFVADVEAAPGEQLVDTRRRNREATFTNATRRIPSGEKLK